MSDSLKDYNLWERKFRAFLDEGLRLFGKMKERNEPERDSPARVLADYLLALEGISFYTRLADTLENGTAAQRVELYSKREEWERITGKR